MDRGKFAFCSPTMEFSGTRNSRIIGNTILIIVTCAMLNAETGSELFIISFRLSGMATRLGTTCAWPILSLEIHSPICYARRSVPLVFFGNPINENQRGDALPKRGKIAILTPKSPLQNCKMISDNSNLEIEELAFISGD